MSSLLLLWGLPSEVLMSLAQGHHFDDARSFVLSKQRDVMVMDQNDMMPLSMPEFLEKFAGYAEPLLGQLGLKKGIYTYIHIYIYADLPSSYILVVQYNPVSFLGKMLDTQVIVF